MVADENYVHDVSKIPCGERLVKIVSKQVNFRECDLSMFLSREVR
jgi:hypothetical protein